MSRLALLGTSTEESYARLRKRLDGLTDDEYFWEPVSGCWNIYQDAAGRWTYHYAIPDPDPAPVTSIGWQVVHLATSKVMYREWAYGPARLTFPDIVIPDTAGAAISMLDQAHLRLRGELAGLSEPQLDDLVKTNWGELWPAWRIFSTMADHDALHGGAIGSLRDLYRWRQTEKK
jgi:DinB family protein